MRNRPPDAVELVGHDPLDPATTDFLEQAVEFWPGGLRATDFVGEELHLLPAALLAIPLQLAQLGIVALVFGANSNVGGCESVHTNNTLYEHIALSRKARKTGFAQGGFKGRFS
jgi:hypothetical protein